MWYYAISGKTHGPVDKENIRQLVEDGDLRSDDLVWNSSLDDWKCVSRVKDIHPTPPPLPSENPGLTGSPIPSSDPNPDRLSDEPNIGVSPGDPPNTHAASDKGKSVKSFTYANFGRRTVAYFLDMLIVFFGTMIPSALIGSGMSIVEVEELSRLIAFPLAWLYFALSESSEDQATWGKQVMGLKVTDTNHDRIGFWKATGRHFGKILSGLTLLIGYIMAAFTMKHQALHDMMAGCLVVDVVEDD